MKRVLTAVILVPIVVLALFKAPLWLFALLVFGVAALAASEYFGIMRASGFEPLSAITYVGVALVFLVCYLIGELLAGVPHWSGTASADLTNAMGVLMLTGFPAIVIVLPLLLLLLGMGRESLSKALPDAALSYMAVPYVGFTLALLVILRAVPNGALYLLYLMLLVWCGDIAAYYVGRAIGKHKLAPRISPGKSWEGAVASILGAIIVGLLLFKFVNAVANGLAGIHLLHVAGYTYLSSIDQPLRIFPLVPWGIVCAFAVCVNAAAQLGDLAESAMKRGAGIKDSGTLLPGHGGILDRIDALLFALPVGFAFYLAGLSRYFLPVATR